MVIVCKLYIFVCHLCVPYGFARQNMTYCSPEHSGRWQMYAIRSNINNLHNLIGHAVTVAPA